MKILNAFNNTDLETELSYSPKVNAEHGVANFVRWYKDYFGA